MRPLGPLWIALWWLLAVMIWDDLSARLGAALARAQRVRPTGMIE